MIVFTNNFRPKKEGAHYDPKITNPIKSIEGRTY